MALLNPLTMLFLDRLRLITPARASHGMSLGTALRCSEAASACIRIGSPKPTFRKNSAGIPLGSFWRGLIAQHRRLQFLSKEAALNLPLGLPIRVHCVPVRRV